MSLVIVDVDSLQLQIWISHIVPSRVDAMLITDHLPELRADKHSGVMFEWIRMDRNGTSTLLQMYTVPLNII